MKTFHKNAIEVPADVIKIQALNKLRAQILAQREVKSVLYAKVVEANEAFQNVEKELQSLERALELSEVM
jgi:anaerobic glycerol-3-phosphate dehydrogenase